MDYLAIALLLILILGVLGGFIWSPLVFALVLIVLLVWALGFARPWGGGRRYSRR